MYDKNNKNENRKTTIKNSKNDKNINKLTDLQIFNHIKPFSFINSSIT